LFTVRGRHISNRREFASSFNPYHYEAAPHISQLFDRVLVMSVACRALLNAGVFREKLIFSTVSFRSPGLLEETIEHAFLQLHPFHFATPTRGGRVDSTSTVKICLYKTYFSIGPRAMSIG